MELRQPLQEPGSAPPGDRGAIVCWLMLCCVLVACMVVLGGYTRLTESGLSITEWKPVAGTLPPLSEQAWQTEFAKYQQIPEYQKINYGMTLAEFKNIFWVEYLHRLLGRITGAAFLLPFLYFLVRGKIKGALGWRLGSIFLLGGLQGALGWYMVSSGLSERTDVSQYRLMLHLTLAFILFGLLLWSSLQIQTPAPVSRTKMEKAGWGLVVLILLQVMLGALVAGTNAGLTYNTFPLMDGRLIPVNLFPREPWYIAIGEDITTLQFLHRWGAFAVAGYALAFVWKGLKKGNNLVARSCMGLAVGVAVQIMLGIATLVFVVPLPLALLHQLGALLLFGLAINCVYSFRLSKVRECNS